METTIQEFMTQGVFAFILTFVRIGSAMIIMPGLGDTFTPQRIRLTIALGLSFAMSPLVKQYMPDPIPGTFVLFTLIAIEFIIGIFIGTIARTLMAALDTAGMVISMMSGLGNAQVFNPGFSTQGSLLGTLLSLTGIVLVFTANLHHLLFMALIGSYELFPVGYVPEPGGMSQMMGKVVADSFRIGVQLSAPFIIISFLIYVAMGILARLMPQIQVFILALPVQILASLSVFVMAVSAIMLFWLQQFEDGMSYFLQSAGP
jgi:flagellar biosynthetic protein FliR